MAHNKHTLTQYDNELEAMRRNVMLMGSLVANQIQRCMEALMTQDISLIEKIIADDHRVNGMEVEIDEKCVELIARRQPTANDLRMVMTIIKTIKDLERIGDEAKNIARMARQMAQRENFHPARYTEIRHAARLALEMLERSLDAFARIDISQITHVLRTDVQIDMEFRAILRYLVALMMEDPRTISAAIEILFVAKSVERMGDHAQNIGEYIIYLVEGRNARHISVDEIEQELNARKISQ
ncbi:MAG: phosphate signaling complex protein PhoU [Gallionella sp.]|jgi:phosphate transport system protein|nr:phosphate signaling complex protein PhoU [Gallionella sp.]